MNSKNNINVLFVSSGNSKDFKIAPFIISQGESLRKTGVEIFYYTIQGKGLFGYLKNIIPLRKFIRNNDFDIIHAHYGLSALEVALTFSNLPIVVSLMGADIYGDYKEDGKPVKKYFFIMWLTKLAIWFADYVIVKSENIKKSVKGLKNVIIIPNGVDTELFKPLDKLACRSILNLPIDKQIVIFLGNKQDSRKNFKLVKGTLDKLNKKYILLIAPYPLTHEKVTLFMNASDVLILTSRNEGSPNVIKEAMACNTPIASTNVGDVEWLIGNTEGCYITSFDPEDVAEKLKMALKFTEENGKTKGRGRIIKLGLDSETVAKRIKEIYQKVLSDNEK